MNKNFEIDLEREVAREGTWELLARVHKLEDTATDTDILKVLEEEISKIRDDISKMTLEELEIFKINFKFLNFILKKAQGVDNY